MNRRKSKRIKKRLKVTVISDNIRFKSYTGDISAGGISVKTSIVLPNDTLVNVELALPSGEILSMKGKVKWEFMVPLHGFHRNGMGIQFTEGAKEYNNFR